MKTRVLVTVRTIKNVTANMSRVHAATRRILVTTVTLQRHETVKRRYRTIVIVLVTAGTVVVRLVVGIVVKARVSRVTVGVRKGRAAARPASVRMANNTNTVRRTVVEGIRIDPRLDHYRNDRRLVCARRIGKVLDLYRGLDHEDVRARTCTAVGRHAVDIVTRVAAVSELLRLGIVDR